MHPEIARAFLSLGTRYAGPSGAPSTTRPLVLTWIGRRVLLRLVPA